MFVECRIFVLGLQLLWSHCLVYQQFWLEKIGCVFKYVMKSAAMARQEYDKCLNGKQATRTASQVEAEKGDQNCIWFSRGSSHLSPNAAFATGLLLLITHFNGIGTSMPVLCSPWIPLSHTWSQQILTEQWWIYWHAQGYKHEKIRFVQTSQEPGAQKTAGTISNDMDIFKLCRDLLPPWYFYLEKTTRKHLFASRWGLPSPHSDAKHLLLQESCDCSCSFSQTPLPK